VLTLSAGGRALLASLALAFAAVQLACTATGTSPWPFAAYDMFDYLATRTVPTWIVVLVQDDGVEREVYPGNVVPVEFFRANALFRELFGRTPTAIDREAVVERLLARLNQGGWPAFDETWPAAVPEAGTRFVDLRVVVRVVRLEPTADGALAERISDRVAYPGLDPRVSPELSQGLRRGLRRENER
jgi:hypothetical protein